MSNKLYQSVFFLYPEANYSLESFFVSEANEKAFRWAKKTKGSALLIGPSASGKTHLAHIWSVIHHAAFYNYEDPYALEGKSIVCDNAELLDQHLLFTLYNVLKESGGCLFLTMKQTPQYAFDDLRSRLQSLMRLHLLSPGQMHVQQIMLKLLGDYHVHCEPDVLTYIIDRIAYSYNAIQHFILTIIKLLPEKKNLTKALAREALMDVRVSFA